MGMLDGILGGIVGGGVTRLVETVMAQHGGLGGLVSRFQHKGLGDVVQSWVSTGPNQAISAQQMEHAIGTEELARLALKFGLKPADLAHKLSEVLPRVVDQMTPGGALPK